MAHSAEIQLRELKSQTLISVVGNLEPDDGQKFETVAGQTNSAIVVFDSHGGSLIAGLRIGDLVNSKGFLTAIPDGATCASACAIAWLGGRTRFLGQHGLLGFHAAYSDQKGVVAEVGQANAILGAYLAHLGLSYPAIAALTAARPDEMNWLDVNTANRLGIAVRALRETQDFNAPFLHNSATNQPDPKLLQLRRRRAGGILESSLYLATIKAGIPTDIAIELIHIFSPQVDFQHDLHAGATFEVCYEYYFTSGGLPAKAGNILYAALNFGDRPIVLYRYQPDPTEPAEYFDPSGVKPGGTLRRLEGVDLQRFLTTRTQIDAMLVAIPLEMGSTTSTVRAERH
jgi:hypothetical protein